MKKILSLALVVILLFSFAVGCSSDNDNGNETPPPVDDEPDLAISLLVVGCSGNKSGDDTSASKEDRGRKIVVISREDGSGTRGAFVEIVGVEDADGNDATYLLLLLF